jgi:ABC-type antimicrobial peptide transport system permease subunit
MSVGLYGTLFYHVLQRTREIGVRMALGAGKGIILRMVLLQGLRWAGAGVLLGAISSVALGAVAKAWLHVVRELSPVHFAAAIVAIIIAVATASYLPARRAALLDPNDALRAD